MRIGYIRSCFQWLDKGSVRKHREMAEIIHCDLIGDRTASFATAITFPARLLAAQRAPGALVGLDVLIDGLVADGDLSVHFEMAGDLFRTPCFGEFEVNYCPGPGSNARAVLGSTDASL